MPIEYVNYLLDNTFENDLKCNIARNNPGNAQTDIETHIKQQQRECRQRKWMIGRVNR